jgi:ferredoxin
MIVIDGTRCTGCGVCLSLCPQEAIVLEAERAEMRHELCIGCGICISACPERAIQDVDLAPVVRPSPAGHDLEPSLAVLPPAAVEQSPTRHRPVRVVHDSRLALESRPAVAAAVAMGPFAIEFLGRLVDRWFARSSLPDLKRGGQDSVACRPGDRRRRRWRGGRCS